MEQYTPVPKVAAAGIAGAVTVIIVFCLKQFAHIEVPSEVAAALTAVISFAAGYMKS